MKTLQEICGSDFWKEISRGCGVIKGKLND
jgi:hypothetical protein